LLGYKIDSLYKLTFKEFITNFPKNIALDKDAQIRQFTHFENQRKHKIQSIKEKRKQLLNNHSIVLINIRTSEDLELGPKPFSPSVTKRLNMSLSKISSSGFGEERINVEGEIEKIKEKQKKKITTVIDHKYTLAEFRKRNKELMESLKSKEEKIKKSVIMRNRSMEIGRLNRNDETDKKQERN